MAKISGDIKLAAEYLKKGEIIAIPTETVYGLAGNAFNETAVSKIFEAKKRPFFNPLIVHTNSIDKVFEFAELAGSALKLAEKFWPGPLTLLLPKKELVPDIVTAGNPVIAVRIPGHPLTLKLLELITFPLSAPSANPFGYVSPTSAEHVNSQLGNTIPFILDGGPCNIGIESTIVGFDFEDNLLIYRVGGLSVEELEAETGKKAILLSEFEKLPKSPGRLQNHYATSTPFLIGEIKNLVKNYDPVKTGIISFKTTYPGIPVFQQMVLSLEGNLQEAAKNLFSAMRRLDTFNLDIILAEEFPEIGLGRAINDRLKKASENK